MKKIAVDIDDSLISTISRLVAFHNDMYGTKLKESDFHTCHYVDVWGGTQEESFEKAIKFYKSDYHKDIPLVESSKEILTTLVKEGIAFSAVSGRINSLAKQTKSFIENNFPNIFTDVYLTNYFGITGVKIKKSDVCKRIKADAIIDDDMDHVLDCALAGIPVFVFDRPWNQGELPEGAIRMMSWKELPYLISTL